MTLQTIIRCKWNSIIPQIILVVSLCSSCDHSMAQTSIVWGSIIDVASQNFGNNRPRVVTNLAGDPMLIWGKNGNVMFSKWNGSSFAAPIQINPSNLPIAEANWMGPSIASHGDTIYIVVKETPETDTSSHIWCFRSFDGGNSFSNPVRVDYISDSLSRFTVITTDDNGNPIVAFLKISPNFGNHDWVVCKSADFGSSFSTDVLASKWSSATSEACDCCPGELTVEGNNVVMLYRDNNSNNRDNWAGLSSTGGSTFQAGVNLDQLNWILASCPSSGPDGIIVGDTLYSVTMNGSSGTTRTYYSKTSISNATCTGAIPMTSNFAGLAYQNFPRIAKSGNAVAIVWKQAVSGRSELPIIYTDNVQQGIPFSFDTVTSVYVNNPDVAMKANNIHVVWQDGISGTVKYRNGMVIPATSIDDLPQTTEVINAYPNPSADVWQIDFLKDINPTNFFLFDKLGKQVDSGSITSGTRVIAIGNSNLNTGIYFLRIESLHGIHYLKLVKN